MAHPQSQLKTEYPSLSELLRIPRGYKMVETTHFTAPDPAGGNVLLHVCRICGKTDAEHPLPQRQCPPKFILVDENNKLKGEVVLDHDYTKEELLLAIGSAFPEIATLIKELGQATAAAQYSADIARYLFEALFDGNKDCIGMEKWMSMGEARVAKLKQGRDVLQNIAYRTAANADQLRQIAKTYIEGFIGGVPKPSNVVSLVDENDAPRADGNPDGDQAN